MRASARGGADATEGKPSASIRMRAAFRNFAGQWTKRSRNAGFSYLRRFLPRPGMKAILWGSNPVQGLPY